MTDDEGRVISIFELAAAEPYQFSQLTLMQLKEFIALMEMGTKKFLQEMDNSINLTIQQEFTSIHPSVEWKFRKVASKYFLDRVIERKQSIPDPIVFADVHPLYGQADIVGSSQRRNDSIRIDLTDNLDHLARRGYISPEIEDLELEKMQGVEGLKAIRVTVRTDRINR